MHEEDVVNLRLFKIFPKQSDDIPGILIRVKMLKRGKACSPSLIVD